MKIIMTYMKIMRGAWIIFVAMMKMMRGTWIVFVAMMKPTHHTVSSVSSH